MIVIMIHFIFWFSFSQSEEIYKKYKGSKWEDDNFSKWLESKIWKIMREKSKKAVWVKTCMYIFFLDGIRNKSKMMIKLN
jgi:hypothetical protein